MSFNTSDGTFDPGMYGSIMQGLQLLNTLGKSASLVTTLQGGDNSNPNGMSSSGVTAATHRHATTPKGINSTQNSSRMACVHSRPNNSTTHQDSRTRHRRRPPSPANT